MNRVCSCPRALAAALELVTGWLLMVETTRSRPGTAVIHEVIRAAYSRREFQRLLCIPLLPLEPTRECRDEGQLVNSQREFARRQRPSVTAAKRP